MTETMKLEVLTPEKLVLSKEVRSVNLQGSLGRLGILPQHTALITTLDFGRMAFEEKGSTVEMLCGDGIAEVMGDRVTVLVRSAELARDIDVERAKAALSRAKSRRDSKDKDIDVAQAEAALYRALERLKFVGER